MHVLLCWPRSRDRQKQTKKKKLTKFNRFCDRNRSRHYRGYRRFRFPFILCFLHGLRVLKTFYNWNEYKSCNERFCYFPSFNFTKPMTNNYGRCALKRASLGGFDTMQKALRPWVALNVVSLTNDHYFNRYNLRRYYPQRRY